MRKIDTASNPDYPCKHLTHGLCNINGDVKLRDHPPCDLYGGCHCIRWDNRGKLRSDIKFSDCKDYETSAKEEMEK